jgi:hypothetical protein
MTEDDLQLIVKAYISYDPDTGFFTWKKSPTSRLKVTTRVGAGTLSSSGYLIISLAGKRWQAHRLAWFCMTGEIPKGFIDHIDGNKLNNKFSNLRECSRSDNSCNSKKQEGVAIKGIRILKSGQYEARVGKDGSTYRMQSADLEEATNWLVSKREELHKQFTRHG